MDGEPVEISSGVYWVGALDPYLRAFDLVMPLKKGTSYNSYLIIDEKITLIDAVKSGFYDQFKQNISEVIDPTDIDYIVINHFEQDHTGTLNKLLETATKAEVIVSKNALPFLKETLNRDIPHRTVSDDTEVSLGERSLRFYRTPFLHWPDTMIEYLVPDNILFTCDAFGFHYCELHEERVEEPDYNLWYYYDLIMRPFREYVAEAVEKIKDLDVRILCPSHGPFRKRNPDRVIDRYRHWSTRESHFEDPTVLLVYASFYRNTARLAEGIAGGLTEEGLSVHSEDISYGLTERIKDKAEDACGIVLGTPTMAGSPIFHIWDLFKQLSIVSKGGKPAAVFGSYGWNAAGIKIADDVLRHLRFKVELEPLKVRLVPNDADIKAASRFGRDFAHIVKQYLSSKKPVR